MIKMMGEAWFIRVDGKEFGPADVETLREWKADGRVLPTNEARPAGVDCWITAAEIPGLFEPPPVQIALEPVPALPPPRTLAQVLRDSLRIYGRVLPALPCSFSAFSFYYRCWAWLCLQSWLRQRPPPVPSQFY